MTTALDVSSGRIVIRDTVAGSDIVFDTDERMFVCTDFIDSSVVGSHVCPARVASSISSTRTDVNVDVDTNIAAINAAADTVFGAFKVTVSGFDPMGAGGWFVGNGSYLHAQFLMGLNNEDPTLHQHFISGAVALTFRASGGQLIFNERTLIRATFNTSSSFTVTATMPATTVDFKMFCGSFV